MKKMDENKLVGQLSEIVAHKYGVHPDVAKRLRVAAMLHDIGKQQIPNSIVNKPGKLDKHEFEIMKTHTLLGAKMLASIQGELGIMVKNVCLYHHEFYDGTRSYWGKYSCDLPAYVSIVSICDLFVALRTERIYKAAWPLNETIDYIRGQAGKQFSPQLVDTFTALAEQKEIISALFADG